MPALTPRRGRKWMTLAKHFHQPRAAVLCHIMHWGLSHGQAETRDGGASEGPVRHLHLYVDTEFHERVEKAATAAGSENRAMAALNGAPDHALRIFPPAGRRNDRRSGPMIPASMAHASCCGWIRPHRPSFSNSSASLEPQKPRSSGSSSCKPPMKIFPASWHMGAAERSVPPIQQRETKNNREMTR